MKTPSFLLTIASLGLVLGACSAAEEPAPTGGGDTVEIPDADIPSQEDADAKAADEINEENADEAFSDLEAEILGDS